MRVLLRAARSAAVAASVIAGLTVAVAAQDFRPVPSRCWCRSRREV